MLHARVVASLVTALLFCGTAPTVSQSPQRNQGNGAATTGEGTLEVTVLDPSGARVPRAGIQVQRVDPLPSAPAVGEGEHEAQTNGIGFFEVRLPPGTYRVTVDAPGFRIDEADAIVVTARERRSLTLRLQIAARPEQVSVDPSAGSTSGADNRSALSFSGSRLAVLSDDPALLKQELIAMAGAGSGLTAPQFYVDGFSNGQLPPKAAIRSIRINGNPFSAEYDRIGFGRIEVTTQPGGQQLHGAFETAGSDDAFNARNPYTGAQPPYYQLFFQGNLNGPLGKLGKKSSFFLAGNSTNLQNNAVVNAATVDTASLSQVTLSEAVPNPQRNDDYSLRLDRQVTANNTLNGRYEFNRTHLTNGGVGLLVLPSEGFRSDALAQTVQVEDNQILGPKMVSDARAEYIRTTLDQNPNDGSPAVLIEGAANAGGSPMQQVHDTQDHFELQENLALDHGRHYIRMGGRYRLFRENNASDADFNGAYVFPSLTAYQLTLEAVAANPQNPQIQSTCTTTTTGTVCGGATQFSFTTGQPAAAVMTGDVGVYAEDDWKLTETFSLDLGFRFESQTAVPDHSDPEPRIGFAWAVGPKSAKTPWVTLRGGFGLFAERFDVGNLLTSVRQNGTRQVAYFVQSPNFYCSDNPQSSTLTYCNQNASTLTAGEPTIYRVAPNLRSSYDEVVSLTAERSIGHIGSVTANFLRGHGVHEYLSLNANAPLPGTFTPGDTPSGTRPMSSAANVYEFTSDGSSDERIFFSNVNLQATRRLYVWGFYVAQHNGSDSNGATSFAAHPYDPRLDYGPQDSEVGQQIFCGFQATLPYGLSLQPFFSAHSGRHYNIITGTDLNGDTIYNDRPAFATDLTRASVVRTALGDFDTDPQPGQTLAPYNYGHAPGFAWLGMQASKSVHIGPRPKAAAAGAAAGAKPAPQPDRPWTLAFTVEVANLLNHTNPGLPVGVVGSPFFGRSISLASDFGTSVTAANRTVTLHSSISF